MLVEHPDLVFYYRNVAMLSEKVMRGIGFSPTSPVTDRTLTRAEATELARYLNRVISKLLLSTGVTRYRHLEILMANLGDSLGGSSLNEVE